MNILIPLAEGFEEIEAATTIDVLRRAGLNVTVAGIPGTIIKGSRNVKIIADKKLEDINPDEFDALVLVGGDPGYKNLGNSQKILKTIHDFDSNKKILAAICAAPLILAREGILDDKKATIYPGFERKLQRPRGNGVVIDGNIITSQGPGTAMEFALKIVEVLQGKNKSSMLKKELVFMGD